MVVTPSCYPAGAAATSRLLGDKTHEDSCSSRFQNLRFSRTPRMTAVSMLDRGASWTCASKVSWAAGVSATL